MHDTPDPRSIDRREVIRGFAVSALAGAATVVSTGSSAAAAPAVDDGGVAVVDRTLASGRAVIGDAAQQEVVEVAVAHRHLRAGDRVIVNSRDRGGFTAEPLFFNIEGEVEEINDKRAVVGGITCVVDNDSRVYLTGRDGLTAVGFDAYNVRVGAMVGLLCIDNQLDGTRTVHALYPLGA